LAVSEGGVALGTIGEDWAVLGQYLSDWEGRDSILLQARFPYRFAPTIADLKRYALLSSAAVAMLILVVLLRLLERVVVRPLGRLTRYSVEIGKGGPRSAVPASTGADELGTLSREIERMLDRLEELRRAAADASRQAGKSEVATYVLHNVGNALNGATVSTGMVRVAVEQMAIDRIERVADVLEQEAHDLPRFFAAGGRGPHLVPYARQLAGALAKQRSEVLAELVRLEETMQRVVTIVLAQKSLVGGPGYPERLALAAQIEEVMEVVRSGPEGAAVQWQRAFEDVPMAVLDRHRLMEILLVLLRNACEAARAAQLSRAVVTVRLRALDDRRLCIEVEDNGAELPPEERLLIFAGGGTHPPGSRGCGLHQASNAATELGGRLEAESPGGGAGMRFRLELPLQPGPACPTREPAGPQALPLLARQVAAMGETSQ
jgi:signal transduction histidine kinase